VLPAAAPGYVALVRLDAGPTVVTNVAAPIERLEIGRRVHAVFHDVSSQVTLVRFALDMSEILVFSFSPFVGARLW